jgi:cyclopropane-fatty-acyl-phospholipid synthase
MSIYLPDLIKKPIAHGTDLLRGTLGSVSWLPVLSLSKATVTSLFVHIEYGTLLIIDESTGKTEAYGQKIARENRTITNGISGKPKQGSGIGKVELLIRKETFWVRLFLFADMGFAEAFMLGEIDCPDLTSFFQVGIPLEMATQDSFVMNLIDCSSSS